MNMKKILIFSFVIMLSQISFAQLNISNQANGNVILNYGESNDYSLYDPQGDTEIYLYLWLNTDQTTPNLAMVYNDDWNGALLVLNYDSNAQKFTGTINLANHDFFGEGLIPDGTQVNNFNLILRNQAGDRQSIDLLASNYGFQPVQINGITEINSRDNVYFYDGNLILKPVYTGKNIRVQLYDINGKSLLKIKTHKTIIPVNNIKNQVIITSIIIDNNKHLVRKIKL